MQVGNSNQKLATQKRKSPWILRETYCELLDHYGHDQLQVTQEALI